MLLHNQISASQLLWLLFLPTEPMIKALGEFLFKFLFDWIKEVANAQSRDNYEDCPVSLECSGSYYMSDGREKEIIRNIELANQGIRFFLWGPVGVGKTCMASFVWSSFYKQDRLSSGKWRWIPRVRLLNRRKWHFIWLDVTKQSPLEFLFGYAQCIYGFSFSKEALVREGEAQQIERRLKYSIRKGLSYLYKRGKRAFVVIDGVNALPESILLEVASSQEPHVFIITSRYEMNLRRKIQIKPWSKVKAAQYLEIFLSREVGIDTKSLMIQEDIKRLVEIWGTWPSILERLGYNIKRRVENSSKDVSIHEILTFYASTETWEMVDINEKMKNLLEDEYNSLDEKTRKAFRWLSVFGRNGFLDYDAIKFLVEYGGFKEQEAKKALNSLYRRSLIEQSANLGGGRFYHLIYDYAQAKLRNHGDSDQALRSLIAFLKILFKKADINNIRGAQRALFLKSALFNVVDSAIKDESYLLISQEIIELIYEARAWLHEIYYAHSQWEQWLNVFLRMESDLSTKSLVYIYEMLGNIKRFQDKYDKAIEYYDRAIREHYKTSVDNIQSLARCYWGKGRALSKKKVYKGAIDLYHQALQLFKDISDQEGQIDSYIALGEIYSNQNAFKFADECYQQALLLAKNFPRKQLRIQYYVATLYWKMGRHKAAKSLFESIEYAAQRLHDDLIVGYVYRRLGEIAANDGSYRRARKYFQKALRVARRIGDLYGEALIYQGWGNMEKYRGRYQEALVYLEKALRLLEEMGQIVPFFYVKRAKAEVLAKSQQFDEALMEYTKILQSLSEDEGTLIARVLREIAQYILIPQSRYKEALARCHEANSLVAVSLREQGFCYQVMGDLYRMLNKKRKALEAYCKAWSFFQAIDDKQSSQKVVLLIHGIIGKKEVALSRLCKTN